MADVLTVEEQLAIRLAARTLTNGMSALTGAIQECGLAAEQAARSFRALATPEMRQWFKKLEGRERYLRRYNRRRKPGRGQRDWLR